MEIGFDITQPQQTQTNRQERGLLEGVAAATNHLLTIKDFPKAMTPALSALGNVCQVDRVYIFENHLDPDIGEMLTSQRFEWTNPIVEAQIDNSKRQNLSYASILSDGDENLTDGKPIGGIVRDLPPKERLFLTQQCAARKPLTLDMGRKRRAKYRTVRSTSLFLAFVPHM